MGKRRKTQIICKLILGGMRVSGYFWDGEQVRPIGNEIGILPGILGGEVSEATYGAKNLLFWVPWKCIMDAFCLGIIEG